MDRIPPVTAPPPAAEPPQQKPAYRPPVLCLFLNGLGVICIVAVVLPGHGDSDLGRLTTMCGGVACWWAAAVLKRLDQLVSR